MKFLRKTHKAVALFFLINFGVQIFAPTVSYALTSGPTAPEATSFEPVDTTDLVNLSTGDFVYNTPLLEVPGPDGGYPLSLSYHAGIQPNEEASWVGLGFTLNPGAINRNVNGYPDDHRGISNVDRVYWEGGERKTYNGGVSIGIANTPASVSFGLSFSQDTYLGFGVGGEIGLGLSSSLGKSLGIGANVSFGINPYGGATTSGGLGLGIGNAEKSAVSLGVGASFNNFGLGGHVGIRAQSFSLVGASISSNSSSASLSVGGGVNGVDNSKAGNISTSSDSWGFDIPVYPGISVSLGYNYVRYWSDETARVKTYGVLYPPDSKISNFDEVAFDNYSLLSGETSILEEPVPERDLGGSFPNSDNYYVSSQGLSGSIRPYIYKNLIFRQNRKRDGRYDVRQYPFNQSEYRHEPIEFRFDNDFSNKYLYSGGEFTDGTAPLNTFFDDSQRTGENDFEGIAENHLAGSKHIEWYTNDQIVGRDNHKTPKEDGFVEYPGFERVNAPGDQIGGFKITNESGVTYHYALPTYIVNEFFYSENIDIKNGKSYNSLRKPTKYAYTWFLTAVTGPDYVDRNNDGKVNIGDWGYWVDFGYKKFSNHYQWRNPSEGFHIDLDNNFQNYSSGMKEIYYLDFIKTATHTALFIKSERFDSREVMGTDYMDGKPNSGGFEFGPTPKKICYDDCRRSYPSRPGERGNPDYSKCRDDCDKIFEGQLFAERFPQSSLKLDRIILVKNQTLVNKNEFVTNGSANLINAIRAVDFSYDYSLVPGTSNSYDSKKPENRLGKLTLLSINYLGKHGKSLMPPINFFYDINSPFLPVGTTLKMNGSYSGTSDLILEKKDAHVIANIPTYSIVRFKQGGTWKYGVVYGKSSSFLRISVASLGKDVFVEGAATDLQLTKNPPYDRNKYDVWNMYKSDAIDNEIRKDENLGRMLSGISASSVDAWSLRTISTSLGSTIKIDYESDDYSKSAISKKYQFSISIASAPDRFSNLVYLYFLTADKTSSIFKVGDYLNLLLLLKNVNDCGESFTPRIVESTFKILDIDIESGAVIIDGGGLALSLYNNCPTGSSSTLVAGHVGTSGLSFRYGGGIRVKNILLNSSEKIHKTSYEYKDALGNSSGVVSQEPFTLGVPVNLLAKGANIPSSYVKDYNRILYKSFSKIFQVAKELPAPGVMYQQVTVSEFTTQANGDEIKIPNHTSYQFETFNDGMVKISTLSNLFKDVEGTYDGFYYRGIRTKDIVLRDATSRIGNLKSMTLFDGSGHKISETINEYLHDNVNAGDFDQYERLLNNYRNQGVIHETTIDGKFLNAYNISGIVSRRHQYPSIKTGQTNVNYKTGITTKTKNIAFDFYSGQATKTLTVDSYGNRYVAESLPAYKRYTGMGLMINKGKNMLIQTSENYSYTVDGNDKPTGLLSASIQTWSDNVSVLGLSNPQLGIWRKQASYQWNGLQALNADGTYSINDFNLNPFNWTNPQSSLNWEKTGEITLYDTYSHGLEATDINGQKVSTRMDPEQVRVIASTANAAYNETAYSGAEFSAGNAFNEGDVNRRDGNPSIAKAHTGKYSLLVNSNGKGFSYTLKSGKVDLTKKYRASVWLYTPNDGETQSELNKMQLYYSINGVEKEVHPILQKSKSKSWYLVNLDIMPNGNSDIVVGVRNNSVKGVYFDDFRVHPIDASMTAYVYDPFSWEVTHMLDGNNLYTHYEYDAIGRLVRSSREQLNFDFGDGKESFKADKITGEVIYNYGKKN
jgi:hypothetical protein